MCRRQLILTVQTCSRALQHSQLCGQLQLGPSIFACQLHTAAVYAVAAVSPSQQYFALSQACRSVQSVHIAAQQQLWGPQKPHGHTTAAAQFSTSHRQHCEEDLRVVQAEMPEAIYHHRADETLHFLQDKLEEFVEDMDIDGGDVEHSQGVLTVKLGSHGTYVINKQTPNRQIWLSSPLTGPFRYDFHDGSWVYHRDGRELLRQLQTELQELLGTAPHLVG